MFIFAECYSFKVLKNSALSVLCSNYDSIEEEVQKMSSETSAQSVKQEDRYDEMQNMLENSLELNTKYELDWSFPNLWNELKRNRKNNVSLFDEVFTFNRQSNVTQL